MGRKIGVCHYSLEDVRGEKARRYRDTSGVDKDTFIEVLSIPKTTKNNAKNIRSQLKADRDCALLRLLWGNALRRGEISSANISRSKKFL